MDDVERFEEELTVNGEVVIGATVGTFDQLFRLVARATDAPVGPAVSRTQRLRLAREAGSKAELGILATSSRRPGFPTALEELVSSCRPRWLTRLPCANERWRLGRTSWRSRRSTSPT